MICRADLFKAARSRLFFFLPHFFFLSLSFDRFLLSQCLVVMCLHLSLSLSKCNEYSRAPPFSVRHACFKNMYYQDSLSFLQGYPSPDNTWELVEKIGKRSYLPLFQNKAPLLLITLYRRRELWRCIQR